MICLSEAEAILQNAMHVIDNPAVSAVTCTPDYLGSLVKPTDDALNNLITAYTNFIDDDSQRGQLIRNAIHTAHTLATYLMQAKFTSNTSKDISFGDSEYFNVVNLNFWYIIHVHFNPYTLHCKNKI